MGREIGEQARAAETFDGQQARTTTSGEGIHQLALAALVTGGDEENAGGVVVAVGAIWAIGTEEVIRQKEDGFAGVVVGGVEICEEKRQRRGAAEVHKEGAKPFEEGGLVAGAGGHRRRLEGRYQHREGEGVALKESLRQAAGLQKGEGLGGWLVEEGVGLGGAAIGAAKEHQTPSLGQGLAQLGEEQGFADTTLAGDDDNAPRLHKGIMQPLELGKIVTSAVDEAGF